MPIETKIDFEEKLVHATCKGEVSASELYDYQNAVWMNNVTYGYNCIFDMSGADLSQLNFSDLIPFATNAVNIDNGLSEAKLAVVIFEEFQEMLTKFYHALMELTSGENQRNLKIFYSGKEAINWVSN